MNKIVLQKFIAHSGISSRRQAEELIKTGKITVNGEIAKLGDRVDEQDKVEYEGKQIKTTQEKIYIKLNKPVGYTCTNREFKGEKNIFTLIPIKEKLSVAGRLDKNSSGLVIVTNDGDLVQELSHPSNEHEKKYVVRIMLPTQEKQKISQDIINKFKAGIDIGEGDGIVKAKRMKYLNNNQFEIVLTTGKKRQIRRMFKALNYYVQDLKRIQIGKYKLGRLPEGKWEEFTS
ncbi:MAG: pseudouridine synthase [Patescibacteria group bacterium]